MRGNVFCYILYVCVVWVSLHVSYVVLHGCVCACVCMNGCVCNVFKLINFFFYCFSHFQVLISLSIYLSFYQCVQLNYLLVYEYVIPTESVRYCNISWHWITWQWWQKSIQNRWKEKNSQFHIWRTCQYFSSKHGLERNCCKVAKKLMKYRNVLW